MTIPINEIVCADVLEYLCSLPDNCVHCCVTSPPYWGLRDYGVDGQLGLEKTPEEYVARMVDVFREVRRVLRDDGTLWLNLGDSYATDTKGCGGSSVKQLSNAGSRYKMSRRLNHGIKPKDLVGIPWRVAFALQADGWWLRSEIIWAKPNPMPESVTDRPTKAHEQIFLMTKSARYFYDAEAIKEPLQSDPDSWGRHSKKDPGLANVNPRPMFGPGRGDRDGTDWGTGSTRNARSVWTIATEPYPEAHFATFPTALVNKCIMAGTSERGCCPECGKPWVRMVEKSGDSTGKSWHNHAEDLKQGQRACNEAKGGNGYEVRTIGWRPACKCGTEPVPCVVLDPFVGSGTTAYRAREMGRNFLACDLSPEYVKLANQRIAQGVLL